MNTCEECLGVGKPMTPTGAFCRECMARLDAKRIIEMLRDGTYFRYCGAERLERLLQAGLWSEAAT